MTDDKQRNAAVKDAKRVEEADDEKVAQEREQQQAAQRMMSQEIVTINYRIAYVASRLRTIDFRYCAARFL